MSESSYKKGFKEYFEGKNDPPGNTLAEFLDRGSYDFYHKEREDYRKGRLEAEGRSKKKSR